MKPRYYIPLAILILFLFIAAALSKQSNPSNNPVAGDKLRVTASFYPMYFFASQIGKDMAEVVNLTPAGAEPHEYEPTTSDIARISKSNMLVLNGGKLEAWGDKIKSQLQGSSVLVVIAGEGAANRKIAENGQTILDPHIFLDPVLAKQEAQDIEKGYEKINPSNASYFQANAKNLEDQLDGLNNEFKNKLSNCQRRDFVTSHTAFSYLAARYNLNQVAISGISPDEEPTPKKLAEIVDFIKKENIKVIFFEKLVSPKLSQTIALETGAQTLVLDPIEGITQEDIKTGQNYFTIMKRNLNNLQIALQCKQ